ncbi:MAG: hypothetical protein WBW32_12570 [Luteibacter sp.]
MRAITGFLALCTCLTANASTGRYPGFGIDYGTAIQYDFSGLSASNQPNRVTTNGYFDITNDLHFRFNPNNEIWLSTEISPVTSARPGERRWLGGTGLNVADLNWYHQGEKDTWRLGKIDLPFGRAQSAAPGLYTGDFVSPYALGGLIGGTYERRFSSYTLGTLAPSLSVYAADTSVLSRAFFRPSTQARRSDGGATNTGKPNNVAAVLNWRAPAALPYLEVQLGYMANHKGDINAANPTAANEQSRTASVRYLIPFAPTTLLSPTLAAHYVDIVPFVEYVRTHNENGVPGFDTSYLTTSLTLDTGRLAWGLTHTHRHISPAGSGSSTEYLTEASVVYHLTGLIDVGLSGGRSRQAGQTSNLLGVQIVLNGAF